MATHYIQKYASTADFLAASVDNGTAEGLGFVSDVLYQNIGGAAFAVAGGKSNNVSLVTTRTVLASENGKTFFLNLATGFVTTLPAVAAGLRFQFFVGTAPSGGSYTIVAASGTPIHGMVLSKDLNGATDSGATAGTGVLTVTIVDGKAQKGDAIEFYSDGTNWFVRAFTGGNFDSITLS